MLLYGANLLPLHSIDVLLRLNKLDIPIAYGEVAKTVVVVMEVAQFSLVNLELLIQVSEVRRGFFVFSSSFFFR